jgi:cytochrome b
VSRVNQAATVPVWDAAVRLLHWTLVGAITVAWTSTLDIGVPSGWHEAAGYTAMACVALRVLWGFVGGRYTHYARHARYAHFAGFVHSPHATWRYALQVRQGTAPRHIGHNPLGGWMVLALLLTVGSIALTGWLQTTDPYWGSEPLEQVQTALAWGLLALIALHVAGVVLTGRHHRENLVTAMLNGRKMPPSDHDVD